MRVAVWVKKFPPRYETFIVNQIHGLVEHGCDVDVIAAEPGEPGQQFASENTSRLQKNVFIRPSIPTSRIRRLFKASGLLAQHAPRHPRLLRVFQDSAQRASGSEGGRTRLLFEAIPFLQKNRYDVVHCQYGPLGVFAAGLRRLGLLNGKIVTAFRGFDIGLAENDTTGQYRRLFHEGELFLPVSDDLRIRLIDLGCDPERVVVLRSGIDIGKIQQAASENCTASTPTIVTVGRLVRKKGIGDALEAVARIQDQIKNLRYLIIGDGPIRGRLEQQAADLGLQEIAEFAGWREHTWVIEQIASAALVLAPSVTTVVGAREGVPNVLKEAMALGLPVVATRHGGIPELVEHGTSGLLAPEHDVEKLALHIETLLNNAVLRQQMGQAGRDYVAAHYDRRQLNDCLTEIYQQLLTDPSHSSIRTRPPQTIKTNDQNERRFHHTK